MICLSSFSHSFMPCLPLSFAISSLPCSPPMTSAPFGVLCPYLAAFPGPHISIQFAAWVQTSGVLKWLFIVGAHQRLPSLWSLLLSHLVPLGIASPLSQLCYPPRLPWLSLWQPHLVWHMCLVLLPTAHLAAEVSGTFKSCKLSSYSCHPIFDDTKFQEVCLSLPIPAFNYTPLLLLMFSCLLV